MECKTFREQAWQFREKSLGREETEACEAHLATCADCRSAAAGIVQVGKYIEAARKAEPSPFMVTRIIAGIEAELERQSKRRSFIPALVLRPVLLTFALAAGTILGITGASSRISHLPASAQQDASIQTVRSDLYLSDLMDEEKILTLSTSE